MKFTLVDENLKIISQQIKGLKSNQIIGQDCVFLSDKVDIALQNIRAQIKKHKN